MVLRVLAGRALLRWLWVQGAEQWSPGCGCQQPLCSSARRGGEAPAAVLCYCSRQPWLGQSCAAPAERLCTLCHS